MNLRIGTRGSALARAQAADVARRLEAAGHTTETVVISTVGDRVTDRRFTDVGAFGVFVREIETALLERHVDVAVHSYKDLPSASPEALVIGAVPERLDPADLLLAVPASADAGAPGLPLRPGVRVGTSAARRRALVRQARPDLELGLLRGNVPTRVQSLSEGRFDAIVLASAGLTRLARAAGVASVVPAEVVCTRLDPRCFVPAPSQGAVAVQVRRDDADIREAVAMIDDLQTVRTLAAERELLRLAEAGCNRPFGAWCAVTDGGRLSLVAALGDDEDGPMRRAEALGDDPLALAGTVWAQLEGVPA